MGTDLSLTSSFDFLYHGKYLVPRHLFPVGLDVTTHVVHACSTFPTKPASKHSVRGMHRAEMFGEITALEKGTTADLTSKTFL